VNLTINFGSTDVAVEADDDLVAEIAWLRTIIASAVADGFVLAHGRVLTAGWATFRFLENEGILQVHEPDFQGDPFTREHADISVSLRIIGRQFAFNTSLNAAIKNSDWAQLIIIKKGVLSSGNFYLERSVPKDRKDSGWYVGSLDGVAPLNEQLEAIRSYRLLDLCPLVLNVLLLPAGWLVVFKGGTIDAVIDQDGISRSFSETNNE
jgi:hypothetical protein